MPTTTSTSVSQAMDQTGSAQDPGSNSDPKEISSKNLNPPVNSGSNAEQQPENDEDNASSDEVKVYTNEEDEEREAKPFESQNLLSDDKSGLINESEQSKDTRRHDHAFAASKEAI